MEENYKLIVVFSSTVLEVPELEYLDENEFHAHFDEPANPPENVPVLIAHYTPPHVMSTPR